MAEEEKPKDWRLDFELITTLIKSNFLNKSQFDFYLSQAMRENRDVETLQFAANLIETYALARNRDIGLTLDDLSFTIHHLRKLERSSAGVPEFIREILRKLPPQKKNPVYGTPPTPSPDVPASVPVPGPSQAILTVSPVPSTSTSNTEAQSMPRVQLNGNARPFVPRSTPLSNPREPWEEGAQSEQDRPESRDQEDEEGAMTEAEAEAFAARLKAMNCELSPNIVTQSPVLKSVLEKAKAEAASNNQSRAGIYRPPPLRGIPRTSTDRDSESRSQSADAAPSTDEVDFHTMLFPGNSPSSEFLSQIPSMYSPPKKVASADKLIAASVEFPIDIDDLKGTAVPFDIVACKGPGPNGGDTNSGPVRYYQRGGNAEVTYQHRSSGDYLEQGQVAGNQEDKGQRPGWSGSLADGDYAMANRSAIVEAFGGSFFVDWMPIHRAYTSQNLAAMKDDFLLFLSELNHCQIFGYQTDFMVFLESCLTNCLTIGNDSVVGTDIPTIMESQVALARFVSLFTLYVCDESSPGGKVFLIQKILEIVRRNMIDDFVRFKTNFLPAPYKHLLRHLLKETATADFQPWAVQIAKTFAVSLRFMGPHQIPSFAYAWIELTSNPALMLNLLRGNGQCWVTFAELMTDLLTFMCPLLLVDELTLQVRTLYKGTIRLLMIILHACPTFLVTFGHRLLDLVPPSAIQLRNVIQSAQPNGLCFPAPFDRKMYYNLGEICKVNVPKINYDLGNLLGPGFKQVVDSYLDNRTPLFAINNIKDGLKWKPTHDLGSNFNIKLMNALVLYVSVKGLEVIALSDKEISFTAVVDSQNYKLLFNLVQQLGIQGRYLMINAIMSHLRYPSTHTQFFILVILSLFMQSSEEQIKEQISRTFFEHLLVCRPWPWGLVVAFIELTHNSIYNFWDQPFNRDRALLYKVRTVTPMGYDPKPFQGCHLPDVEQSQN